MLCPKLLFDVGKSFRSLDVSSFIKDEVFGFVGLWCQTIVEFFESMQNGMQIEEYKYSDNTESLSQINLAQRLIRTFPSRTGILGYLEPNHVCYKRKQRGKFCIQFRK